MIQASREREGRSDFATSARLTGSRAVGTPLVTIAIPTFNRAPLLNQCVKAALAQTYPNIEVLVSDNASTDETPQTLTKLSHPKLRVIRQAVNIGMIPNWNACLAEASGEYVVFVSDDDEIDPELVTRCMTLVEREPGLPLVASLTERYRVSEGKAMPAAASRRLTTGIWNGTDILVEYFQGRITVQMCTVLFRTTTLRSKRGFSMDFPHATDLAALATVLLDGKAGFVNECYGRYQIHDASVTSSLDIDVLLRDATGIVRLVSDLVSGSTLSVRERRRVKSYARRHSSLYIGYLLSDYCWTRRFWSDGLGVLWRWRSEVPAAATVHVLKAARKGVARVVSRRAIAVTRRLLSPQS